MIRMTEFRCRTCLRLKPIDERGTKIYNNQHRCQTCDARIKEHKAKRALTAGVRIL